MKRIYLITFVVFVFLAFIALLQIQGYWVRTFNDFEKRNQTLNKSIALKNFVIAINMDNNREKFKSFVRIEENDTNSIRKFNAVVHEKKFRNILKTMLKRQGIEESYAYDIISFRQLSIDDISQNLFPITRREHLVIRITFDANAPKSWEVISVPLISNLLMLFIVGCFLLMCYYFWKAQKTLLINKGLFNNMTHEIKTPLTNIKLALGLLSQESLGSDAHRLVATIEEENKKLIAQSDRILRLSKLESGSLELDKTLVNVDKLLQEVIKRFQPRLIENKAVLKVELKAPHTMVTMDRLHFSNVFSNLMDNAIKYAQEVPNIWIKTYTHRNNLIIQVIDKGIGIDKSKQKYIFDSYYRVYQGNRHEVKGYGLGLAYVRLIIGMHNGKIKVTSHRGKGSEFKITIPIQ